MQRSLIPLDIWVEFTISAFMHFAVLKLRTIGKPFEKCSIFFAAVKLWKSDKKSKRRSGFDLEELVSGETIFIGYS